MCKTLIFAILFPSLLFAQNAMPVWGNIQYENGGAVPGLPAQLLSVKNGEQSTLAGKCVPVAFAYGTWIGTNVFKVSEADGQAVSISRNGLTNEDGTAEIGIYRDEAGTQLVSLNESFEIPSNGVLVLWVTGNYEASEEFTYQVGTVGAQGQHKIKVRLPKLQFVKSKTDLTIIPRSQAFGSDPTGGATRVEREVYMGEGLERFVAAFDPADGSLCTTCNFPIRWSAWLTDEYDNRLADKPTDNSVIRADAAEIVNGVGQFTFRGFAEINGPGYTPAYAALSVHGPSTLENTKAFWDGMVFTRPDGTPVRLPQISSSNSAFAKKNVVHLQTKNSARLDIYNIKGRLEKTLRFSSGAHSVSLSHLPKGMYSKQ